MNKNEIKKIKIYFHYLIEIEVKITQIKIKN